jgi:hypothetical protein
MLMPFVAKLVMFMPTGAMPDRPCYLKSYDPNVVAPDRRSAGDIQSTINIGEAVQFETIEKLYECYMQVCEPMPLRPDGEPNRPLTAFTITVESIYE